VESLPLALSFAFAFAFAFPFVVSLSSALLSFLLLQLLDDNPLLLQLLLHCFDLALWLSLGLWLLQWLLLLLGWLLVLMLALSHLLSLGFPYYQRLGVGSLLVWVLALWLARLSYDRKGPCGLLQGWRCWLGLWGLLHLLLLMCRLPEALGYFTSCCFSCSSFPSTDGYRRGKWG